MVRRREDKDDANVTTSMFFIFTIPYFALIDIGSMYSYISSAMFVKLDIPVECTTREYSVISPLGQSVRVDRVFNQFSLEIQGFVFLANLMELLFGEFDLILGMDWLVEHRVSLDCIGSR